MPLYSDLYDYSSEPIAVLRVEFFLLCERGICASLLLDRFYTFSDVQRIRIEGANEEDEYDPAIYNTVSGITDWFVGLFTVNEIEEALKYLADKGYIRVRSTFGSDVLEIECNLNVVAGASKPFKADQRPIHTPQYTLKQINIREAERKLYKLATVADITEIDTIDEERRKVRYHNSRAKKAKLPATLTIEEWLETLDHFDWKCAYCLGIYALLEHFIPLGHGVGTTKDNCVPACSNCNNLKQAWNPLSANRPEIPHLEDGFKRVQEYFSSL